MIMICRKDAISTIYNDTNPGRTTLQLNGDVLVILTLDDEDLSDYDFDDTETLYKPS